MLLYNCEDHFHLYFLSAVRSYDIIMSFSSYDGYTLNSHLTNLLPRLFHRYRGGHGFESRWNLRLFSGLLHLFKLWGWLSLVFFIHRSALIWSLSYTHHIILMLYCRVHQPPMQQMRINEWRQHGDKMPTLSCNVYKEVRTCVWPAIHAILQAMRCERVKRILHDIFWPVSTVRRATAVPNCLHPGTC